MKIMNLGCGGHRPQLDDWWNLDCLKTYVLKPGTPEWKNLCAEPRYIECDLGQRTLKSSAPGPLDGVLCQHVLEHLECHHAADVIRQILECLAPGGQLVVTVPDVDYFMANYSRDTRERAVEIFGEPISEPEHASFFSYALFHREHVQLLNWAGLMALLVRGGFSPATIQISSAPLLIESEIRGGIEVPRWARDHINRRQFSLLAVATSDKPSPQ